MNVCASAQVFAVTGIRSCFRTVRNNDGNGSIAAVPPQGSASQNHRQVKVAWPEQANEKHQQLGRQLRSSADFRTQPFSFCGRGRG